MTVLLLKPYATFAQGATVDLDNATESALVTQGLATYTNNPGPEFSPLTAAEQQQLRDSANPTGPNFGAVAAINFNSRGPRTMLAISDSKGVSWVDGSQLGFGSANSPPPIDGYGGFTNQSYGFALSWPAYAAMASRGAIRLLQGAALPSWTTASVDQWWDTRVANQRPDIVVLEIGFNNIFGASDSTVDAVIAALKAWWTLRTTQIRLWGGMPVWSTQVTVPTTWGGYTVAKKLAQQKFVSWIRQNAAAQGAALFDFARYVTDSAKTGLNAGEALAAYGADLVHPSNTYRRTLGYQLWNDVLQYMTTRTDYLSNSAFATGLLNWSDPMFLSTSGGSIGTSAGALPTGCQAWVAGPETTYAVQVTADGNWVQVTTNTATIGTAIIGNTASQPGVAVVGSASSPQLVAGATLRCMFDLEVQNATSLYGINFALQVAGTFNGTAGTNIAAGGGIGMGSAVPGFSADAGLYTGTVSFDLKIPLGYTAFSGLIFFIRGQAAGSAVGTNQWRFRRLTIEQLQP